MKLVLLLFKTLLEEIIMNTVFQTLVQFFLLIWLTFSFATLYTVKIQIIKNNNHLPLGSKIVIFLCCLLGPWFLINDLHKELT